eukprot:294274-Alexandrium_andersonii.AAC.1
MASCSRPTGLGPPVERPSRRCMQAVAAVISPSLLRNMECMVRPRLVPPCRCPTGLRPPVWGPVLPR